jgi:ribonuclease HI
VKEPTPATFIIATERFSRNEKAVVMARAAPDAAGVLGTGRGMSSNDAESYAALEALRWALRERAGVSFVIRSDGEFVVKASLGGARAGERETAGVIEQLEATLRPLHDLGLGRITWIPRQINDELDVLTRRLYLEVDGRTPRFGPRAR